MTKDWKRGKILVEVLSFLFQWAMYLPVFFVNPASCRFLCNQILITTDFWKLVIKSSSLIGSQPSVRLQHVLLGLGKIRALHTLTESKKTEKSCKNKMSHTKMTTNPLYLLNKWFSELSLLNFSFLFWPKEQFPEVCQGSHEIPCK